MVYQALFSDIFKENYFLWSKNFLKDLRYNQAIEEALEEIKEKLDLLRKSLSLKYDITIISGAPLPDAIKFDKEYRYFSLYFKELFCHYQNSNKLFLKNHEKEYKKFRDHCMDLGFLCSSVKIDCI